MTFYSISSGALHKYPPRPLFPARSKKFKDRHFIILPRRQRLTVRSRSLRCVQPTSLAGLRVRFDEQVRVGNAKKMRLLSLVA